MQRKIKYVTSTDIRSKEFNNYIISTFPEFITEQNPDLILVSGGDGAMLHAIQSHSKYNAPFFGYAAGTLNYLMNSVSDYKEILEKLLDKEFELHITETPSISVNILNNEEDLINLGYAVNEVVFGQDVMGYHSYCLTSDDKSFDKFHIKGTGISICTDLGSTGYNFNLDGSILPLGSNLWSVVGVVCNRYLNDILPIQKITISSFASNNESNFSVFIDGIKKKEKLEKGEVIELNKGCSIKIAFLNKTDFISKRVDITSRYRKN